MREWMRGLMRKRSKRGPNDSEATGKIGQEIPANQPAPIRPSYESGLKAGDSARDRATPVTPEDFSAEPESAVAEQAAVDAPPEAAGKLVVETQPESPSVPPPEQQVATTAHNPRGFVVLAIGLPGSGKTTWFKRRGVTPLSSDLLRTLLFDDIAEQRYQGLVFSTLRSLLRARLIAKMPWNYVDATNLSPHERRQWIKMAKSFGYDVQAVFFDVPLEVCLERNSRRERVVTEEAMQRMAEKLRPPSFKEGFSKITLVRVKSPGSPGEAAAAEGE
jgi:predicted kinase